MNLDFEITPGRPNIRLNRDLALISLHPNFTSYLHNLYERVRPIDLPIMDISRELNFKSYNNGALEENCYVLSSDWEDELTEFSGRFKEEYPEIEQVYVFSKWSGVKISKFSFGSVSNSLGRKLNDVLLKRFLILDIKGSKTREHSIYKGYEDHESDWGEVVKTIQRSLRFNSW
jgi:hypothetical protein